MSSVIRGQDNLDTQDITKRLPTAWVNFDGTDGTIKDSYNVSSITKNSTGKYTIFFTAPMLNGDYVLFINFTDSTGRVTGVTYNNKSLGNIDCYVYNALSTSNTTNNYIDRADISVVVFGGQ